MLLQIKRLNDDEKNYYIIKKKKELTFNNKIIKINLF